MNLNKKMLVSDYDKTFYLNDEDIENNKTAIDIFRKNNNIFVIATGRSYLDFNNKKNKYKIVYDWLIINHGATILNSKNDVIYNFSIKNEIIPELKTDLEIDKATMTFCCSGLESRVDFNHQNLTKIYIRYNDKETVNRIVGKINKKFEEHINAYSINENTIEIISKETDKSYAIELLLKQIDVNKENVYTIGDGYSDIKMSKEFNGYCMKESVEELKVVAKKEYESVSLLVKDLNK